MSLVRHDRRALLGGAVFAATAPRLTWGQIAWPNRPIKVLVPYAAGGSADNAARSYTDRLATALGQPIVVENRPGASGTLAASVLTQAPGDGYTLMVAPTAVMAITPAARRTPYDPVKDITALARLAGSLGMLTITNELGVKTLPDFIKLARANPGKYAFGSSGVATITHLTGEILQQSTGIKLQHVPYKSIVEGVGDLLAGRIAMVLDPFILPQVKAGRATAVASLNRERNPEFPEVPTTEELGIDIKKLPDTQLVRPVRPEKPAARDQPTARCGAREDRPRTRTRGQAAGFGPGAFIRALLPLQRATGRRSRLFHRDAGGAWDKAGELTAVFDRLLLDPRRKLHGRRKNEILQPGGQRLCAMRQRRRHRLHGSIHCRRHCLCQFQCETRNELRPHAQFGRHGIKVSAHN